MNHNIEVIPAYNANRGEARSQFKNRDIAMLMIQFALIELGFNSEYVK